MPHFPPDHRDLQRDSFEQKPGRREQPAKPDLANSEPPPSVASEDPDFEAPESDSLKKLVRHIVDEMPGHVTVAIALVAFMFFYGMANSMFKLTGRELASLDFPLGLVSGTVGSLSVTGLILRIKYRKK